jgi:hypothetical protein
MLEPTDRPFVLRVDDSAPQVWDEVVREVTAPAPTTGLVAEVDCVDAAECIGLTEENVRSVLAEYRHTFVFVADALTMTRPGHPLLVIDLREEDEPSFRALPRTVRAIESRLTSGEADFADFGEMADDEDDGVFRGLAEERGS